MVHSIFIFYKRFYSTSAKVATKFQNNVSILRPKLVDSSLHEILQ